MIYNAIILYSLLLTLMNDSPSRSGLSGAHHDMSVFQYSDFGQKITHTDRLGNYFVLGDAG